MERSSTNAAIYISRLREGVRSAVFPYRNPQSTALHWSTARAFCVHLQWHEVLQLRSKLYSLDIMPKTIAMAQQTTCCIQNNAAGIIKSLPTPSAFSSTLMLEVWLKGKPK